MARSQGAETYQIANDRRSGRAPSIKHPGPWFESSLLHQSFQLCRDFPEAAPIARVLRAFCVGV
jgi:hypothetical protein